MKKWVYKYKPKYKTNMYVMSSLLRTFLSDGASGCFSISHLQFSCTGLDIVLSLDTIKNNFQMKLSHSGQDSLGAGEREEGRERERENDSKQLARTNKWKEWRKREWKKVHWEKDGVKN